MLRHVDTREPQEVEREVATICDELFPKTDSRFVGRALGWIRSCFEGRHPGYQAIDLRYHDLEHTHQGTLCMVRLLQGWHHAGAKPTLSPRLFELGLLAILFHDTGYLKRTEDTQGTGAKYTAIHVARSAEFAQDFLSTQGYAESEVVSIQNMIRCTGVSVDLAVIPFQSEWERLLGYALATADLLGQMAAPDYVDKLPVLFDEFAEAAHADEEKAARFAIYQTAEDLRRMTPVFWENYVLPRINEDFRGLYRFLNDPYPDGPNAYLQAAEQNVARLRRELGG